MTKLKLISIFAEHHIETWCDSEAQAEEKLLQYAFLILGVLLQKCFIKKAGAFLTDETLGVLMSTTPNMDAPCKDC